MAVLTRRPGPTPALADAEHYELGGVKVVGLPGVFSAGRADKATSLLLETLEGLDLRGKAVLDLGCGTGLIGPGQRSAAQQSPWPTPICRVSGVPS
ncbi:methyltransferase [Deinococcus radiophilus]|uniref:methyltransferase n=1 Tax=Deinococcus radiophilus TaxID=32062 RepID=UPI003613BE31